MSCLDDNDVLALVAGTVSTERLGAIEAHLDGCSACRQLAAAAAQTSANNSRAARAETARTGAPGSALQKDEEAAAPSAQQLGRYSVLKAVGAGAMGVVYAAYDPVLDRRVALKLLHAAGGDAARLRVRLLREAQAMARLSHPNVITVHDVGTVHDQVFVAMEFVEGCTLSEWIKRKQPWREVLRVFILAGRGLAAAHAAGLVHRDFKPENVLIGDDGRVRVTDFGLAWRERNEAGLIDWNLAAELPSGAGSLSEQGALIGSPAYMAPEQMRGESVDQRADEFSFAVALYEALYGERPFAGANLSELRAAIEQGRVRPEPAGTRVPGWVRRALLRGVAFDPQQRFPTLEGLLEALADDPAVSRKRALAGATAVLLLLGLFAFLRWESGRGARACQGAESRVQRVWTSDLKQRAQAAFAQSKLPYAAASWTLAEQALDLYASNWSQLRTEACEATAVRHEQSPELLDLRMSCLDDRLRELGATASLFAQADPSVVAKAGTLAGGLKPLADCSDARALREPGAPTEAQREQVEALRDRLAQTHVRAMVGKDEREAARAIVAEARTVGYAPLEAQALLEEGRDTTEAGDELGGRGFYLEAAATGLRARVDTVVAEAWIETIKSDLNLVKIEEAELAAEQAQAAVSRLGNDPKTQARLALALSGLARRHDKMDEAQRQVEHAVALLEGAHDGGHDLVQALGELGLVRESGSQMGPALEALTRAWKLAGELFGPEHPLTGEMEGEMGEVLTSMNREQESKQHLEHALSVLQAALGPDHPAVADLLTGLGNANIRRHPKEAIGYLRRSVQNNEQRPPTSSLAYDHNLLGAALESDGQLEPAAQEFAAAMELERRLSGHKEDLETALAQSSLGEVLTQLGKHKEARAELEAALETQRAGYGADHPVVGDTLTNLADLDLAEHRLPEARRDIERALSIEQASLPGAPAVIERKLMLARIEQEQGQWQETIAPLQGLVALPLPAAPADDEFDRDQARFLLARALWQTGADRPLARKLAEEARRGYAARGPLAARPLAETVRWLEQHAK